MGGVPDQRPEMRRQHMVVRDPASSFVSEQRFDGSEHQEGS